MSKDSYTKEEFEEVDVARIKAEINNDLSMLSKGAPPGMYITVLEGCLENMLKYPHVFSEDIKKCRTSLEKWRAFQQI